MELRRKLTRRNAQRFTKSHGQPPKKGKMAMTITNERNMELKWLQSQEKPENYLLSPFYYDYLHGWPFEMRIKHQLLEAASPGIMTADVDFYLALVSRDRRSACSRRTADLSCSRSPNRC